MSHQGDWRWINSDLFEDAGHIWRSFIMINCCWMLTCVVEIKVCCINVISHKSFKKWHLNIKSKEINELSYLNNLLNIWVNMWKCRRICGIKGSNEDIKGVYGGCKEVQKSVNLASQHTPTPKYLHASCKHVFPKSQKFSTLIFHLDDKIKDIKCFTVLFPRKYLSHTYLFGCPM